MTDHLHVVAGVNTLATGETTTLLEITLNSFGSLANKTKFSKLWMTAR